MLALVIMFCKGKNKEEALSLTLSEEEEIVLIRRKTHKNKNIQKIKFVFLRIISLYQKLRVLSIITKNWRRIIV